MTKRLKFGGREAILIIENAGLIVIGVATVVAGIQEVARMISVREVSLADLLLLFIYLEVIAMVGIYMESHKLPVRLPIYIAIVALARYVIIDVKEMDAWRVLAVAAGILLLAFAVLVIRYGHVNFPYADLTPWRAKTTSDEEDSAK